MDKNFKKTLFLFIALLMTFSVLFSLCASAYNESESNSSAFTSANVNDEEESMFMRIIHAIFFSKLTFDSNGGSEVPYQYAFKFFGRFKTPANPVKEGYTFAGWEPEIPSRAPFRNVNVKAKWDTNIYTVKWIVDEVTYSSTELPYGVGVALPSEPVKEGYTFNGWSPAVAESMPAKDLTYTAQFTVNSYNVTLKANKGQFADGTATKEFMVDYNSFIKCEEPSREGYVFGGWEEVVPETMPAEDIVLNATWVANSDTKYTVEIYTMNVSGSYGSPSIRILSGETDSEVSYTPSYGSGFHIDNSKSNLSGIVAADGSLLLKAYIARNQYTIKFVFDNGNPTKTVYYLYGSTVSISEPQKEGYNFAGWNPAITTVNKNVTYTAQWKKATEYTQAATEEEFYFACSEMIEASINDENFDAEAALNDPYYFGRVVVRTDDLSKINFEQYDADSVLIGTDGLAVIQFSETSLAESCVLSLQENSFVDFAEPDEYDCFSPEIGINAQTVSGFSGDSWGESYINADKYAYYLESNEKFAFTTVAVVDSGVDMDHTFLKNRITNNGWDYVANDNNPDDENGHGTHVAGIITDCTDNLNVKIMPVRVMDKNGFGSNLLIAIGINHAVNNGAEVINLSLGGSSQKGHKIIDNAVNDAVDSGVVCVIAAGNGDVIEHKAVSTEYTCPAHIEEAIVVGAIDNSGTCASFSNYGDSLDLVAPGVDIISSYLNNRYASLMGTSMAAPHISAAAAMIALDHPDYTPQMIESVIKSNCVKKVSSDPEGRYGSGCLDLNRLIPTNTVSFNTNSTSTISSKTVKNSTSITLPTPTKSFTITLNANGGSVSPSSLTSKCIFGGWYENSSFSGTKYSAGESYKVLKNVTLYAKWTNSTVTPSTPTRSNYKFEGWFYDSGFTKKYSSSDKITANTTLYAKWSQNKIVYSANGGSGVPSNTYGYGTVYISSTLPTRSGYKFLGWSKSPSATSASYSPGSSYSLTSDVTLYAVWGKKTITLSYYSANKTCVFDVGSSDINWFWLFNDGTWGYGVVLPTVTTQYCNSDSNAGWEVVSGSAVYKNVSGYGPCAVISQPGTVIMRYKKDGVYSSNLTINFSVVKKCSDDNYILRSEGKPSGSNIGTVGQGATVNISQLNMAFEDYEYNGQRSNPNLYGKSPSYGGGWILLVRWT